jgi:hypothetical protein
MIDPTTLLTAGHDLASLMLALCVLQWLDIDGMRAAWVATVTLGLPLWVFWFSRDGRESSGGRG